MAEQLVLEFEEWRTIDVQPDFQISSIGRVRRVAPGKRGARPPGLLKPQQKPDGYWVIQLQGRSCRINALVCRAFNGPPPEGKPFAAHWDGNKSNNTPGNIRWTSKPENEADKIRHGRSNRGERHGMSKLNAEQVRAIRQRFEAGEKCPSIAADFNISPRQVSGIGRRVDWAWLPD